MVARRAIFSLKLGAAPHTVGRGGASAGSGSGILATRRVTSFTRSEQRTVGSAAGVPAAAVWRGHK